MNDDLRNRLRDAYPATPPDVVDSEFRKLVHSQAHGGGPPPARRSLALAVATVAGCGVMFLALSARDTASSERTVVADDSGVVAEPPEETTLLPRQLPSDGDRFRHHLNLRGRLSLNQQGCVRLNAVGGLLVWPAGAEWDEAEQTVQLADGTRRHIGQEVNLGLDPSAPLSEVLDLLDAEAAAIVEACEPDEIDPRVSLLGESPFLPLG